MKIARSSGFDLVARFRHQILPSSAYARLPAAALSAFDRSVGRLVGIRSVFVYA